MIVGQHNGTGNKKARQSGLSRAACRTMDILGHVIYTIESTGLVQTMYQILIGPVL